MSRRQIIVASTLFALLLSASLFAASYADPADPDFTPLTIPYQGQLEKSGQKVNVPVDIKVSLWSAADEGTEYWGPESYLNVPVHGGNFSILLGDCDNNGDGDCDDGGDGEALSHTVMEHNPLYLQVEVKGPGDADFIVLNRRQRFGSSPYAIRAYRAMYAQHAEDAESAKRLPHLMQTEDVRTGLGTDDPQNAIHIDGNHTAAVNEIDSQMIETRGTFINWGNDFAFFGLRDRSLTGTDVNKKDAVIYVGDDEDDSIVFMGSTNDDGRAPQDMLSMSLAGGLKWKGEKPFQFVRYKNLGDNPLYSTNYSTVDWNAAIVGFRAAGGDIDEKEPSSANATLISVHMLKGSGGKWFVRADFRTHSDNHEDWEVDVLFVRKDLSTITNY